MKQKNAPKNGKKESTFSRAYRLWTEELDRCGGDFKKEQAFIYESLKEKTAINVAIFGVYFFPDMIWGSEPVADCHLQLLEAMCSPKNAGVVFPRGHGKTTWMKIDTIHDICYGHEPVILYISDVLTSAQLHFEAIKAQLENNDLLIEIYGNLVPDYGNMGKKWTNKHFETTNGVNVVARGACKGRGVNIKGKRPTKTVLDDSETDEQVQSPTRRIKFRRWLNSVIKPSMDPIKNKIKMVGTIIHTACEVLKFYKKHGGIFLLCVEEEHFSENATPIFPELYPIEKLIKKKEDIGSRAFAQEYMNNPKTDETSWGKAEWLVNNYYSDPDIADVSPIHVYISMDPQSGETQDADFYAIAVVAVLPNSRARFVLEILTGKASKLNQYRALVEKWWQYHQSSKYIVASVTVETVITQNEVWRLIRDWRGGIENDEKLEHITNRNIPARQVVPSGKDGGVLKDKFKRLQLLEPGIERGELRLRAGSDDFVDHFLAFPDVEHDDDIDALIYALEESYKNPVHQSRNDLAEINRSGKTESVIIDNF